MFDLVHFTYCVEQGFSDCFQILRQRTLYRYVHKHIVYSTDLSAVYTRVNIFINNTSAEEFVLKKFNFEPIIER